MKAEGDRLLDFSTSMRPTRHRLLTAMGVSACSVAVLLALLGSLVDFTVSISKPGIEHGEPLTVHIRKGESEPDSNFTTADQAVRSLSQEETVPAEITMRQQAVATVDSPEPPANSRPMREWRAIANETVKASVDEYFRREEFRVSMWRRSHSIMFQPASDIVAKEIEHIISDFRFKPRVHVVGLGVTIGSCFIGIPIAGVPVEQRTVAIRLFVCAQDSG